MAKQAPQTLADIEKQIAILEAKAAALRQGEKADVIAKARVAIEHYRITAEQLGLTSAARPSTRTRQPKAAKVPTRKPVAVKYRDESGNTWTGRGNKPRWLAAAMAQGRKVEDFLIKA
jgi:DNA-binding protein H-NS